VRLPRVLRTLAHEAVVTEDGPHPLVEAEPTAPQCARVILAGRATSVPFTAVLNGPERTTTDNHEAASTLRRSPPSQVTILPDLALGASKGSLLPTWLSNYRKLRKSEHTDEWSPGT
jgi:hypothetical protein